MIEHAHASRWKTWSVAAFCLVAFAANSIFCRMALAQEGMDPASFTAVRLLSGALLLAVLVALRSSGGLKRTGSWKGGILLFAYAYSFSVAYVTLGAGVGALVLFGAVQITMFAMAIRSGERVRFTSAAGMILALSGLASLLLPGASSPPISGAVLMVVSGIAWGAYSVHGKRSVAPLADTAGNFVRSLPLVVLMALMAIARSEVTLESQGLIYAVLSGALASGAGYVAWYAISPKLPTQAAASLQLTVPVLAAFGGVLFLGEMLSLKLAVAAIIVLGGVALTLWSSFAAKRT